MGLPSAILQRGTRAAQPAATAVAAGVVYGVTDEGNKLERSTGAAWEAYSPTGSGDVTGQAASVDSEIALFSLTTGKVIKRATGTGVVKVVSGVIQTPGDIVLGDIPQIAGLSVLGVTGSAAADVAAITAATNGHVLTRVSATSLAFAASAGGAVVQSVNTQTAAVATGTTVIPFDDTIPQNTEGDQYLSLAVTPTSATNRLRIDVVLFGTYSVAAWLIAALFQDATAGALAAFANYQQTATAGNGSAFTHTMTAGTTSATTFKVRAGGNTAGTTTVNGQSAGRIFGGVMASSLTITELTP